jgi:hypothetical protein
MLAWSTVAGRTDEATGMRDGHFSCREERIHHSAAWWPQPKRTSPCSATLQTLNTETTENLSDLCIEFFPVTEDAEPRTGWYRAEALLVGEEIFARGQEVWE